MRLELVEVTRLFSRRGVDFAAVDRVNLSVDPGTFLAIVGRSGNGKSTLLHLITGLLKPTSGQVLLDGQDLAELSASALAKLRNQKIGYVTQNLTLLANLTVLDNVILPAVIWGKPKQTSLDLLAANIAGVEKPSAEAAEGVESGSTFESNSGFAPNSAPNSVQSSHASPTLSFSATSGSSIDPGAESSRGELAQTDKTASEKNKTSGLNQKELREKLRSAGIEDPDVLDELLTVETVQPDTANPLIARAMHLLQQLQIDNLAGSYPKELSGGELRRVAVARALINQPELVLADEPTGDLDEASTQLVMNLLRHRADQGATILMVTHDKDTLSFADKVLEMRDGKIV